MTQVKLTVPDISCAHCEKTILETLRGKPGVQAVAVNIPARTVLLKYDEGQINLDQVGELLDEEGYPVESTQAV
jgi:copper chaperone